MRVLMVSSLWPPHVVGGSEIYAARLATELRRRDHEVAVVTHGGEPADDVVGSVPAWPARIDELRAGPAWRRPAFHARDIWRSDTGRIIAEAVDRFRPDAVHTHVTSGMSVSALVAASRSPAGHVHTLHDYWLRCWRSTMTRRAGGPCGPACALIGSWRRSRLHRHPPDVVAAISQAMLEQHPTVRGRVATRVVRHPVDPPRTPEAVGHPRDDGRVTFGYLGQLTPNKGVDVLLRAAELAGVDLLVAGRGRLEAAVTAATGPRIEHLGWVGGEAKQAFFARISCLVVPSVWQEPAGLVVNEARSHGLPVIASDVGGLPEYVPQECLSLLTPPGDVEALAGAMRRFAARPDLYRSATPVDADGWDRHVEQVLGLYALARTART